MLAYLDAALERLDEGSRRSFHDAVEAVRLGTITAHDQHALARWRSMAARASSLAASAAGQGGRGLTGAALERALQGMLLTNPDIVAVRVAGG